MLIPPFLDGELVREEVDQLVRTLEASKEKIAILRITVLLNEIEETYYRVDKILTGMNMSTDREFTLKKLLKKKLIDMELYDELINKDISIDKYR